MVYCGLLCLTLFYTVVKDAMGIQGRSSPLANLISRITIIEYDGITLGSRFLIWDTENQSTCIPQNWETSIDIL